MWLYDISHRNVELAGDVFMKPWKGKLTELNDYTIISDLQQALQNIHLMATITNKKIGLTWDSTMRSLCLKEFQELEKKGDAF